MIDYDVTWVQQETQSQCWYAALKMIVQFRRGVGAEFAGYQEVLQAGLDREKLRAEINAQAESKEITEWEARERRKNNPLRGINDDELPELASRNGLGVVPLPLAWNMLSKQGGWTSEALEAALVQYGPLWCSVAIPGMSTAHVIVVKGVDAAGNVIYLDPQVNPQLNGVQSWDVARFNRCLQWMDHCMMYLPATT